MEKPIKEKYLDEKFKPLWTGFEFPRIVNGKTFITVYAGQEECIELPKEDAEKVVEYHKEFMEKVYKLLGYNK